jgi:hypothetical protein
VGWVGNTCFTLFTVLMKRSRFFLFPRGHTLAHHIVQNHTRVDDISLIERSHVVRMSVRYVSPADLGLRYYFLLRKYGLPFRSPCGHLQECAAK